MWVLYVITYKIRRVRKIHAMTLKNYEELSERLSEKLKVPAEEVFQALKEITREDVLRIAKNEVEQEG